MGGGPKALSLPAILEACVGMYLILRAHKMKLKYDEDGAGVSMVGIAAIIFAQTLMVFSANPPRMPKEALILFKGALCVFSLYVLVTTAESRRVSWVSWFIFLMYSLSAVPVCFMIHGVAQHGKTSQRSRLNELSATEHAAMAGQWG
ncbi:unnamed protein product [Effrenium voratum]|nr:unnamed protein product [Effrenium voratum]